MMKRIRTLESQQEMACAPIKESLRVANMWHEVFEKLYDETKLELVATKLIVLELEKTIALIKPIRQLEELIDEKE